MEKRREPFVPLVRVIEIMLSISVIHLDKCSGLNYKVLVCYLSTYILNK